MVVVEIQKTNGAASDSENILGLTYVWLNRLLWPVVCIISGFTTYWTFTLPAPDLLVKAGGCVFGLFAGVCFLNSLLWWSSDRSSPPSPSVSSQHLTPRPAP